MGEGSCWPFSLQLFLLFFTKNKGETRALLLRTFGRTRVVFTWSLTITRIWIGFTLTGHWLARVIMWLWLYDVGQLKNALPQNVIHRINRNLIGLLRKEFVNDQNSHTHAWDKNSYTTACLRSILQHCWAQHVAWARSPCCNVYQHGGQTHPTSSAQQCCDMLRLHFAIVWPGFNRVNNIYLFSLQTQE